MIPYNKRQDAQIIKIKDYINGKREYVTGEGTSLTLENTANTPFNNIILNGNTSQNTTTGKNLIKLYKATNPLVVKGLTVTRLDDNTLKINGTSEEQCWIEFIYAFKNETWVQTTPLFKLNLDKKYVCIGKNISGTKDKDIRIVFQISKEGNVGAAGSPNMSISIANADGIYRGWIAIPVSTNFNNYTLQFQLEEGTTPTDFEPYTNGVSPNPDYPQEIHCVKGNNVVTISNGNVLPNNLSDGSMNGITYTINDDKSINLSGTATSRVEPKLYDGAGYTIPAGVYKNTTTYNIIGYTGTEYIVFNAKVSTNLTKDVTFKQLYFRIESGATVNKTIYPQIILSSKTDTSYVPHKDTKYELNLGNIELNSIDNYKDCFKKENGKWYKVENIGSYTFEGNEDFHFADVGTINQRFDIKTSVLNIFSQQDYKYKLFTHFRSASSNSGIWGEYYMSRDWVVIKDNDNKMTSLEDFKAWLSANKPTIYYARISPIDIEITDTTLITQLNTLEQAVSYDDITNISQTNANLLFIINVEAVKKLL